MQLEDIHISEHESLDDPELIMEIMEAREELESAESREDVERIRADNQGTVLPTHYRRMGCDLFLREDR